MKCVILDKESIDIGDIDFSNIEKQCDEVIEYDYTLAEDLSDRIKSAEIIITNKVIITAASMVNASALKLICVAATGTNNVDINAASQNNIKVCNVTGYATSSVVQHVFALILSLSRNLPAYINAVQNHRWQESRQFCLLDYPIIDLSGKSLGIIGYGELGKAVAHMAEAFGMNVLIAQSLTGQQKNGRVSLDTLFKTADIISLHCPLTPESKEIINHKNLALMKKSAFLINTARGGVVNENDLWQALNNKSIAAAAIDVISEEPPKQNILLEKPLPNLIITPHIAWASQRSRQKLVEEIAWNIEAFKKGELRNGIN